MPTTLASLLSPLAPSDFRSRYYAQQSVLIDGNPKKFSDLFDLATLRRILESSPVPHPTMKLVLDGRRRSAEDASGILEQCRQGATLILEDVDQYDSRVGIMAANLAREMGEPTRTNLYFSQPSHPGFNRHYDTHDVFILQIQGYKGWRIFDETLRFPLFYQKQHATVPPQIPRLDCVLAPGDVLYVPRGHWHEATAQREPSLHLTVGIYARTGIDFLRWLLNELREDVRWREAFPLTFADELPNDGAVSEGAVGHLRALRCFLAETLGDEEILSRFRTYCIAQDRPVRPFSVPLFDDGPDAFLDDDRFERPGYQRTVLTLKNDAAEVVVWGHVFSFSADAEPALRFIFSRELFSVRELRAAAASLSTEDVEVILRFLLTQGVITRQRA
jgi:ribosomal protein L16 Arg81 hydroxylase